MSAVPDNFGYLLCCYVGDTQEEADEQARHFIWRMGPTLRGPREYMAPVGYRSAASLRHCRPPHRSQAPERQQTFEELKENYHIVCGTPDTVLEKLEFTSTSGWGWSTWCSTARNRVWATRPP